MQGGISQDNWIQILQYGHVQQMASVRLVSKTLFSIVSSVDYNYTTRDLVYLINKKDRFVIELLDYMQPSSFETLKQKELFKAAVANFDTKIYEKLILAFPNHGIYKKTCFALLKSKEIPDTYKAIGFLSFKEDFLGPWSFTGKTIDFVDHQIVDIANPKVIEFAVLLGLNMKEYFTNALYHIRKLAMERILRASKFDQKDVNEILFDICRYANMKELSLLENVCQENNLKIQFPKSSVNEMAKRIVCNKDSNVLKYFMRDKTVRKNINYKVLPWHTMQQENRLILLRDGIYCRHLNLEEPIVANYMNEFASDDDISDLIATYPHKKQTLVMLFLRDIEQPSENFLLNFMNHIDPSSFDHKAYCLACQYKNAVLLTKFLDHPNINPCFDIERVFACLSKGLKYIGPKIESSSNYNLMASTIFTGYPSFGGSSSINIQRSGDMVYGMYCQNAIPKTQKLCQKQKDAVKTVLRHAKCKKYEQDPNFIRLEQLCK